MSTDHKSPKKHIEILGNLCVLVLSLIFTLGLAEIALRAVPLPITKRIQMRQEVQKGQGEVHPKGLYVLSDQIGWTLTPHFSGRFVKDYFNIHVEANSDGIRDHEVSEKQPGDIRILGLGDSFAFGWGVDLKQSFFKKLEQYLNEEKSVQENFRYQVINAGIPGYGTFEPLQFLKFNGMD